MAWQVMNYVDGTWVAPDTTDYLELEDPGTRAKLGKVPISGRSDVDRAAKAAKKVFEEWREVPIQERTQYLFRMKAILEEHTEELAELITREHGKVLSEARGEMKRAIENIDVAIAAPMLMQGRTLKNIATDIDVEMDYWPEGVFAVICPFNFPAMIPFWFLPYAIVTGNTCIIKPSELVPRTMERIFRLMEDMKFPPGVVNLVNGDKTTVDALLEHPDIRGVASVSSTTTMQHIAGKAQANGKKFLCNGGAKNFLVVLPDANLDESEKNILGSVYGNTGQRCLAGSNVVAVGDIAPRLKVRLLEGARDMHVGYGLNSNIHVGPLVSEKARERVLGYIDKGVKEGAKLTLDGRKKKAVGAGGGHYLGPTIFEDVDPRSTIAREEIFGPVLVEMNVGTLDEAISMIAASPFGNAASIYTENRKAIRKFIREVRCGNIGVNIGVPAPIALFPFAGMKESFMGVLHGQAHEALRFFMDIKVVTERT